MSAQTRLRHLLLPFLFVFAALSCSKSTDTPVTPVVVPPVIDTTNLQYGTPFANVPDRQDAAIYQVNMRVFSTQGNFAGVIARLDSIQALGINVLYLMPVFPVGQLNSVNSPYCVKDNKAVNSEFGTLADLRTLVDGAHARNMAVILDWVANHTAWDNPWITAHKDWYLQDGSGHILSPPGMGWNDVAQLNFTNAEMRLEMISDMKYWVLKANVDGFRCDYADGPPTGFWKQAIDSLRNITTHRLLILAEGTKSSNFTAGFDFNFGFNFYGVMKNIYGSNGSVLQVNNANTSEYAGATGTQMVVRYLTNHDVNGSDGTPLDLFGGAAGSMAAFAVAATMKSVPMIYNGQEVGTPFRLTFPFTGRKIDWTLNPAMTAEYKRILAARNGSAVIRRGQLTSYSTADICAFTRELAGVQVLVVANLRNLSAAWTVPPALANTTWTDLLHGGSVVVTSQMTLGPYEYRVLQK